jgi:hypothetical protein
VRGVPGASNNVEVVKRLEADEGGDEFGLTRREGEKKEFGRRVRNKRRN